MSCVTLGNRRRPLWRAAESIRFWCKKPKTALIAYGKYPSIGAVRVALGNTGSKTTICRLLKELEPTKTFPFPAHERISMAILDLPTRMRYELEAEAQAVIEELQAQCAAEIQRRETELDGLSIELSEQTMANS